MTVTLASTRPSPQASDGAGAAGPLQQLIEDSFTGFAGSAGHPCLGARSVVHRGEYDLRVLARLGTRASAAALCDALAGFPERATDDGLSSLVAVFQSPTATTEARFGALLWRQLQYMHDLDHTRAPWDPRVSRDPDSPHFSFSIAGRAYFIVGLHAGSSRWARRFAWPALVFNPHDQFVAMREAGKYERVRSVIRDRDEALQGSVNPVLRDHGVRSEARQYAGDEVADAWQCPLDIREE